jgi:CheY-like chemotaxis protein
VAETADVGPAAAIASRVCGNARNVVEQRQQDLTALLAGPPREAMRFGGAGQAARLSANGPMIERGRSICIEDNAVPTVLVVDDAAVDRRLAGGLLAKSPDLEISYAENGADALHHMQNSPADVVVTDLLMPVMDGLELVKRIRMQYPNVPVILMTAVGSELLSIKALKQGAASYVPKSQLGSKLRATVEEVLSLATVSKTYARLMECQTRIEFSYCLDNDVALIDALVDLVKQIVAGMGLCDHTGRFRIGVAVREALLNALYRGNLEFNAEQMQQSRENLFDEKQMRLVEQRRSQPPFRDRKIFVDAKVLSSEARFVIRDEGSGFDYASALRSRDLTSLDSLDALSGRGLVLIHSFMDEVSYNEAGNEITMIKRRD